MRNTPLILNPSHSEAYILLKTAFKALSLVMLGKKKQELCEDPGGQNLFCAMKNIKIKIYRMALIGAVFKTASVNESIKASAFHVSYLIKLCFVL